MSKDHSGKLKLFVDKVEVGHEKYRSVAGRKFFMDFWTKSYMNEAGEVFVQVCPDIPKEIIDTKRRAANSIQPKYVRNIRHLPKTSRATR